jgi:hypothetical protein
MPFYPSKVLRAKERASTSYFSDVFNLDSHLNPLRSWERIIVGFLDEITCTFDHLLTQLALIGLRVKMLKCKF